MKPVKLILPLSKRKYILFQVCKSFQLNVSIVPKRKQLLIDFDFIYDKLFHKNTLNKTKYLSKFQAVKWYLNIIVYITINLTAFLQLFLELVSKDKNETKKQSESFRNVYF